MFNKVMGKTSAKTSTKRVSKHNPDADMLTFAYCASAGINSVSPIPQEDEEVQYL